MWWQIPRYALQIGVGTGVGVGLSGGSFREALLYSALSTGISTVAGKGGFWRGAWGLSNWIRLGAPLASGGRAVVATGSAAGGMGLGTAAGAVVAGTVIGAATGTAVVAVAEQQGVVYEGATADVLDLYLPGGAGASEWVDVVAPALVQQAQTSTTRRAAQSKRERAKEEFTKLVLGPVLGPVYGFFRS